MKPVLMLTIEIELIERQGLIWVCQNSSYPNYRSCQGYRNCLRLGYPYDRKESTDCRWWCELACFFISNSPLEEGNIKSEQRRWRALDGSYQACNSKCTMFRLIRHHGLVSSCLCHPKCSPCPLSFQNLTGLRGVFGSGSSCIALSYCPDSPLAFFTTRSIPSSPIFSVSIFGP